MSSSCSHCPNPFKKLDISQGDVLATKKHGLDEYKLSGLLLCYHFVWYLFLLLKLVSILLVILCRAALKKSPEVRWSTWMATKFCLWVLAFTIAATRSLVCGWVIWVVVCVKTLILPANSTLLYPESVKNFVEISLAIWMNSMRVFLSSSLSPISHQTWGSSKQAIVGGKVPIFAQALRQALHKKPTWKAFF